MTDTERLEQIRKRVRVSPIPTWTGYDGLHCSDCGSGPPAGLEPVAHYCADCYRKAGYSTRLEIERDDVVALLSALDAANQRAERAEESAMNYAGLLGSAEGELDKWKTATSDAEGIGKSEAARWHKAFADETLARSADIRRYEAELAAERARADGAEERARHYIRLHDEVCQDQVACFKEMVDLRARCERMREENERLRAACQRVVTCADREGAACFSCVDNFARPALAQKEGERHE